MNCTKCKVKTNRTITDCYNQLLGQYITSKERLCVKCARKKGFRNLTEINNERN